ncbi:uncharacterized protein L969DRAFT_515488 [Mixia osmundae IAM 14324]|uniref:uncharacterized protein n=1 Tax=Mixia osmundae (strain CBS 9802 / IAM 14324 / JCM 22182 / KY 12970) TaxID=764103 RepID=UPI0004A546F7|nr:uncharacterized protein L969DRAFT_515488 [Mixia osmundae IAM 14324]KEI39133.1 hypothetical protein L969DRAFT_515488 [Mixia osmundae IAM 14324]
MCRRLLSLIGRRTPRIMPIGDSGAPHGYFESRPVVWLVTGDPVPYKGDLTRMRLCLLLPALSYTPSVFPRSLAVRRFATRTFCDVIDACEVVCDELRPVHLVDAVRIRATVPESMILMFLNPEQYPVSHATCSTQPSLRKVKCAATLSLVTDQQMIYRMSQDTQLDILDDGNASTLAIKHCCRAFVSHQFDLGYLDRDLDYRGRSAYMRCDFNNFRGSDDPHHRIWCSQFFPEISQSPLQPPRLCLTSCSHASLHHTCRNAMRSRVVADSRPEMCRVYAGCKLAS